MTHDELLEHIGADRVILGERFAPEWQSKALRAVVELHKPHDIVTDMCVACSGLDQRDYPCLTIQAVEKELK